ncbi:MAG: sugar phosphate isomerase/epimerase [Pedosphaera sp.]|nr:sugar phosphate isomerase/epimerase [Pedosphaera sp.]
MNSNYSINRRQFIRTVGAASAALATGTSTGSFAAESNLKLKIKLGIDNFAVRAMGWNAQQLIDYADTLKTDVLFITDLKPFEKRDDGSLKDLAKSAADKGIQIYLGSWSICPTSKSFKKDWGTAEEHLALGIRMAKALGSPVFRIILGRSDDRKPPGGIEARIKDTVAVLKSQRSRAMDAGVKIAIENHAGDMQAWELVNLVEEAGKDYVGVNMDSGNAAWTLEDPRESLEILGPYTCATSLRDDMIWESENGAKVQWTAMGEGMIDWKAYFKRFAELCPGVPVMIETISGFSVEFPYLKDEFWSAFPKARARDFAKFVALARRGHAIDAREPGDAKAKQDYQKGEIERSIKYCKEVVGLGLRA